MTGASSRTGVAIANLRRICEQELAGQYELEIIDVLEFPDLAEDEKILATPTLIKSLPLPLRRVIGDLYSEGADDGNFAIALLKHGDKEKAKAYALKARAIFEKINLPANIELMDQIIAAAGAPDQEAQS